MEESDASGDGYAPPSAGIPLRSFAGLSVAFNAGLGGALWAAHRRGRLRDGVSLADLALLGVATHKLSRVLAKDEVTSFARAPFTRYQGPAGRGELSEEARGDGLRKAIGELATCPFCVAQWVAAGMVGGLLHAPRATRAVATVFAVRGVADFLQLGWEIGERVADE